MTTNESSSNIPDKKWTIQQLGTFASNAIADAENSESQLIALARKSTVSIFRAGKALSIARPQIKKGWGAWLKEMKIARTTAHECIKLFEAAQTEKALGNRTPTEAKLFFGVIQPKASSHLRSKRSPSPAPQSREPQQTNAQESVKGLSEQVEVPASTVQPTADQEKDISEQVQSPASTVQPTDEQEPVADLSQQDNQVPATPVEDLRAICESLKKLYEVVPTVTWTKQSNAAFWAVISEAVDLLMDLQKATPKTPTT